MYHHISDMDLKNFADVEKALAKYIPAAYALTGKDITLERTQQLMKALGNPEQKLRIIHVAGTSGKTSTAYFIADLLEQAGKQVGLTVSPHIRCINERIQINHQPLSEKEFCTQLGLFLTEIQNLTPEPTYFELLTAFMYWYFAKAGLDYVVVETGMGGMHDATNVADAEDKVCVITDIGYDHMHVLGTTLPEIAAQKAGIIHPKSQVFMHNQSEDIMKVFESFSRKQHAILNVLSKEQPTEQGIAALPLFQQRNWLLAHRVVEFIAERDQFSLGAFKLPQAVIGRMQKVMRGDKAIIFDGAHNEQKMTAFVRSFQSEYPNQKVPVLLALKKDKEYPKVLSLLAPICSELIITTFHMQKGVPLQAQDAQMLADYARRHGFTKTHTEPDSTKAFDLLLTKTTSLAVVTGSFYLIGALLNTID